MLLGRLPPRLREYIRPSISSDARLAASLLRRQRLVANLSRTLPFFWRFLLFAGFAYLLALPLKLLGRGHYVSENALQPSQVNTYWNWADVHIADNFAADVDKWRGMLEGRRAAAVQEAFWTLGLPAASQHYSFSLGSSFNQLNGTNVYSILQAPKTDGAEALVLSASWLSRALDKDGERRVNVRGVAIVLALANYLKKYSMWSKDIVFLISDGYNEGSQAWLDAYHGFGQTNLVSDELPLTTGPIWAALNVDYPHHSFSHLGLFYEGANGHLPNLDLINTASHIIKHSGIPPILHANIPTMSSGSFFDVYEESAKNLAHQIVLGAMGKAPGPEASFGRYRIDALTFFAVPANGPHGFHSLGSAIESTFRSLNNLLERFHQSFFLYLMTTIDSFISVGNYLAAPILISAGMTIYGLMLWEESALPPPEERRRPALKSGGAGFQLRRPLAKVSMVILITHLMGLAIFKVLARLDPLLPIPSYLLPTIGFILLFTPGAVALLFLPLSPSLTFPTAPLSTILKSLNLGLAGLSIAVVATLNFGGAVVLSLLLPLPLVVARPIKDEVGSRIQQAALVLLSPPLLWIGWKMLGAAEADLWMREMLVDWHVVGTLSLPFAVVVVVPLFLQSAIATLL